MKVVVITNWKINQDYIAEYLCENKDKPELNCAGCCQLEKQLTKTEPEKRQEANNLYVNILNIEELTFCVDYNNLILNTPILLSNNIICGFISQIYTFKFISDILHPPQI